MNRKEFLQASSILSIGLLMESLGLKAQTTLGSNNVTYYTSKDALYNTLRKGFNARINKLPTIIADCKNTKGVQEAILHAKQLNLKVSVKSGGHCMEGFSTGSGMQIIVANLNKIEWLSSYKIKVGPGVLLSQLYDNLIPKNRILQGGSCAAVAVGGLSLGGGYGLMSRLFGLTCDSLERVTMVDGNGNIINSEQDPELLWACKGGGNGNFGVITEMVFKVHNRPSQMSSYRFRSHNLNTERGKEILKTWFAESEKLPKACFSTCLFNKDNSYILLTNVSKSNTAVQSFINKMKSINDKYTANPNVPIAKALKNYYGIQQPTRFKNASAGLYKSFNDIEPIIDDVLNIVYKTQGMIYQLNTLGGAIQDKNFEQKSSFPHRAYPYFSELQTYWEAPQTGKNAMEQFEAIQQIIAKQGITAQYRNYPDINFINPLQAYYENNLPRLLAIKQKYDADNRIMHEQSLLA